MLTNYKEPAEIFEENSQTHPGLAPNSVPRGVQLREELLAILKRVDQLEMAITSFPHVEEDGSSECPWAEDLYAKKEQLEAQVSSDVVALNRYIVYLEKEVQRRKKNLGHIQTDHGKLNLRETSECYSEAIEAQQRQLHCAVQDRDAVSIALAKAEAVLKVSQTRKFPGREPQQRFGFPGTLPGPSQLPSSQSSAGGLGNELSGLISLGPLGQTQGR